MLYIIHDIICSICGVLSKDEIINELALFLCIIQGSAKVLLLPRKLHTVARVSNPQFLCINRD